MNIPAFVLTLTAVAAYALYKAGAAQAAFTPANVSLAPAGGDLSASLLQNTALAPPSGSAGAGSLDTAVRTILGEDDTSAAGMQGVASVLWNRATNPASPWYGMSLTDIALAPNEFDAWNGGADTTRIENISTTSSEYQQALAILQGVMDGSLPDNTGGALYYRVEPESYSSRVNKFFASLVPTVKIGSQQYYTLGG